MTIEMVRTSQFEMLEQGDLAPMIDSVRPYTMVPDVSLVDLARQTRTILNCDIPGDFVECGVWRGGASFLIADLLRQAGVRDRRVWLCDSFEGMPPPQKIDGSAALAWADKADPNLPLHQEFLRASSDEFPASLQDVEASAHEIGLASYTEFVKGWFDQTLPANRNRIGPIALLRIDCDWHASVQCCLENLYDQVVDGGIVIFDDYYTYDGCAIAVHEFLGRRGLAHQIESVSGEWEGFGEYYSARFCKGGASWNWRQRLASTARYIAPLISPGDSFVLVDEEQFRSEFAKQYEVKPFLERDGMYWGPPSDDAMAIRELDRLRRSGAKFVVITRPCFWWLECYAGFRQHLRSEFRCVLENECLVAFDLRR